MASRVPKAPSQHVLKHCPPAALSGEVGGTALCWHCVDAGAEILLSLRALNRWEPPLRSAGIAFLRSKCLRADIVPASHAGSGVRSSLAALPEGRLCVLGGGGCAGVCKRPEPSQFPLAAEEHRPQQGMRRPTAHPLSPFCASPMAATSLSYLLDLFSVRFRL